MRFGTAKEIITPLKPMKIACTGNFEDDFTAVHDDVYVRALYLSDGTEKALFMSFDLLFHDRLLNDQISAYASEKYGVNASAVVVSYTHAHTAPATRGYNEGHHDNAYEELLLERAKACVDKAIVSAFDGEIYYGSFNADFNISRRAFQNGVCVSAPNLDYPRETEFNVLCVKDAFNNVRSLMLNYPCHPVFYPEKTTISGEFPARLCQLLDAEFYGSLALYFQSSAGDVRPRPTAVMNGDKTGKWQALGFDGIDAFCKTIASKVSQFVREDNLKKMELSISADAFSLELPLNPQPIEVFENLLKVAGEGGVICPDVINAKYVLSGGYKELKNSLTLNCQTVKLASDLYVATVGGEPCYTVKQAIEKAFVGSKLIFIGYTDACAYIVDDKILSEGGYEPTCFNEYRLIGPFLSGLNELYTQNFEKSYKRVNTKK